MAAALAPGVEMIELISIFAVSMSAICLVDTSPGKLMRLPPTVRRTLKGSAFCSRYIVTTRT